MKNLITLISFILFAINAHAVHTSEGVGTRGGGNVLNPNPVDKQLIVKAVSQSKVLLIGYFTARLAKYESNPQSASSLDKKLFEMNNAEYKDIFKLLDETVIQVLKDKPCLFNGAEVDGSSDFSSSLPICISAANLSVKLYDSNYEAQTEALVAHELSHLLGATEDEAVELQDDVYENLAKINYDQALSAVYDAGQAINSLEIFINVHVMNSYESAGSSFVAADLWNKISDLSKIISSVGVVAHPNVSQFLLPSREAVGTVNELYVVTEVLYTRFLMADPSVDAKTKAECTERYATMFQGQKMSYPVQINYQLEKRGLVFSIYSNNYGPINYLENESGANVEVARILPQLQFLKDDLNNYRNKKFMIISQ